jgi:hypothetical protein
MARVRLELAEETAEVARENSLLSHEISPSMFLHMGLELEEQQ